jgi:hypothetical protein
MLAIRYKDVFMWEYLGFFAESVGNQCLKRVQHLYGLAAFGFDCNRTTGARSEHHQTHDRCAADRRAFARDPHHGIKAFGGLNKPRRGPGMQAALVDDLERPGLNQTSFARQQTACNIDVFASRILRVGQGLGHVIAAADACQLDQHRQIDAGDHFNAA